MKKIVVFYLFITLLFSVINNDFLTYVDALEVNKTYLVFDENFNFLFQRDNIDVGDNYLSNDFKFYEIVYVDKDNYKGIAKFIKNIDKPKVKFNLNPRKINITNKKIAMYSTHNDESYIPGDGVDSVYGHGGIEDVAVAFKNELSKHFIDVYYDNTLHIPHDTSAYNRSLKTAKKLQRDYKPDAIFDIHRDGASRNYYIKNVDGKERGRVRMVIGKSNPNKSLNEEFAMYLMSVGNEMYPWLFTDIYYGRGHYNQSIDSKSILFEMGSHLVEKDIMIESMKELADVVNTALYGTYVDTETGDIEVNGEESDTKLSVNDTLENKENKDTELLVTCIIIVLIFVASAYSFVIFFYNIKNKDDKKNTNIDKK